MRAFAQRQEHGGKPESSTPARSGAETLKPEWDAHPASLLQRRRTGAGDAGLTAAPPVVQETLAAPGQSLDQPTREFMEARLGHDFSRVRVHTDARAADSARAVDAHAYTVGRDIVFAAGQFAPQTQSGLRLLAHELTHVVQQGDGARMSRSALEVGPADDRLEQEADRTAEAVSRARTVPAVGRAAQPLVQRQQPSPPPRPAPAAPVTLTPEQIQEAIAYNRTYFGDQYSIRTIRTVMGGNIDQGSGVVNEEFVQAVVLWQAAHHLTQDGKVGHETTRSIVRALAARSRGNPRALVDAIWLIIDSYDIQTHWALDDISVGERERRCCGTDGQSDAETLGGPHDPIERFRGQPIRICFCIPSMLQKIASNSDYNAFVRIVGHELQHVPQHQSGTGNPALDALPGRLRHGETVNLAADAVNEFEAWYWETCAQGRMPRVSATARISQARTAISYFLQIPGPPFQRIPTYPFVRIPGPDSPFRTPERQAKAAQLVDLVNNRQGVGPC